MLSHGSNILYSEISTVLFFHNKKNAGRGTEFYCVGRNPLKELSKKHGVSTIITKKTDVYRRKECGGTQNGRK